MVNLIELNECEFRGSSRSGDTVKLSHVVQGLKSNLVDEIAYVWTR